MSRPSIPTHPASPDNPRWSETLSDQSHVVIRPINAHDKSAERDFIAGLSPETGRLRFLGATAHPIERLLEQFTDIDFIHDVSFIAVTREDAREVMVGVGSYSTGSDGTSCECAVTVSEGWQHRGLGTLLMKHLVEVARSKGVRRMVSTASAENLQMRHLAQDLGFRAHMDPDDPTQILYELAL